jgi:colicin import membrane protein
MSEEKKEPDVKESTSVEAKKQETIEKKTVDKAQAEVDNAQEAESVSKAVAEAEGAARAAEEAEAMAKAALEKAEKLKAAAEKAAEAEYKAIADEVKAEAAKPSDYTFKRHSEEIFRREMGEPEFFLDKKDRFPVPILSAEQQEELTRKAEIPIDNTPAYNPENILSPEFGGVSSYESGIGNLLEEARQRLAKLSKDPEATEKEIADAKNNLAYLESLHENYYLGMNVFRTAKGGRSKINA